MGECIMKKTLALILALVMCFSLLTACGNPIQADFEQFLNVDMVDVNANGDAIAEEFEKFESFTTEAEWIDCLNGIVPMLDDSLTKLAAINPETAEVQALKAKYTSAMEAYKEAVVLILEGFNNADEAKLTEGNEKLNEGIAFINEYNEDSIALAEELGLTIE